MFELDIYDNLLSPVSDCEFKKAQENLMRNMRQKSFYREKQFVIYENETISSNFTGNNLRRSYYKNSEIRDADLTNTGFSGSAFVSTNFYDCTINNTKLDFCELDNCTFSNSKDFKLLHLNLNESVVCNSQFTNLNMHAANFTNAIFDNVVFKDCIWESLCLEGTIFRNTVLDNVKFKKLNFEFSFFEKIKMKNIRLPFPTIPYIFNGIKYLMETQDSVEISSAASKSGAISAKEYLNYMDDLVSFYLKTENYFPLANIFIAQDKFDHAYAAILAGIKFSMLRIRNFRLVYYYCKLLQITEQFTSIHRTKAYDAILQHANAGVWRSLDVYNFSRYLDRIRNTLLNESQNNYIVITFSTNILCTEYEKIACMFQIIEDMFRLVEKEIKRKITHYVEIRHNSPYEFFLKAISEPEFLALLLEAVNLVFMGIGKLINLHKEKQDTKIEEKKISILEDMVENLKSEQLEYYKKQTEYLSIENAKLKQQLDDLSANLSKNDIIINNMNYHISNFNL